ncbi:MAG: flagellar basal body rod protein FlgC [Desulfurobacteriaceae bacterium]
MSLLKTISVAVSGMVAQRLRIGVIASNLANVDSTSTPEGGYYKRRDVHFKAVLLDAQNQVYGVIVDEVVKDKSPPIIKYEPGNPDANKDGYVKYPNIDPAEEMTNLIEASRMYQANVNVANNAKNLINITLDILKT